MGAPPRLQHHCDPHVKACRRNASACRCVRIETHRYTDVCSSECIIRCISGCDYFAPVHIGLPMCVTEQRSCSFEEKKTLQCALFHEI